MTIGYPHVTGGSLVKAYLGIDVGSVTTKFAVLDEEQNLVYGSYARTNGRPIDAVQNGLRELAEAIPADIEFVAAGTTGSGRQLTGAIIGADVVKNEITTQAVAASYYVP